MKKTIVTLLFKIFLLLLPFAGLMGFMEHAMSSMAKSYVTKEAGLLKEAGSLEMLVLGSSEALYGIDPEQFALNSFNMANASQSLYYDQAILLKYLKSLGKLKVVVLPISYFTLESLLIESPARWRSIFYEKYYGIPNKEVEAAQRSAFNLNRYSDIFLYGYKILKEFLLYKFKGNLWEDVVTNKGWYCASPVDNRNVDIEVGRSRVEFHHSRMHSRNIARNVTYLNRMINALTDAGIVPVVITMPVPYIYYTNIDPERYRAMQRQINTICEKNKLTYLNYLSDNRFTIDDFRDEDHLNRNGAVKFSRILSSDIGRLVDTGLDPR